MPWDSMIDFRVCRKFQDDHSQSGPKALTSPMVPLPQPQTHFSLTLFPQKVTNGFFSLPRSTGRRKMETSRGKEKRQAADASPSIPSSSKSLLSSLPKRSRSIMSRRSKDFPPSLLSSPSCYASAITTDAAVTRPCEFSFRFW